MEDLSLLVIRRLLVMVFFLILIVSFGLNFLLRKRHHFSFLRGMLLSLTSVALILVIIEFSFTFVRKSHGIGYSFASRLWFQKYWKPINSSGFRDVERDYQKIGEGDVIVIGDSFSSGYGIKKIDDRFSDILQSNYKEGTIYNISKNSLDTKAEFSVLQGVVKDQYPSMVFVQYFLNDIQLCGDGPKQLGAIFEAPKEVSNSFMFKMKERSFTLNFCIGSLEGFLTLMSI